MISKVHIHNNKEIKVHKWSSLLSNEPVKHEEKDFHKWRQKSLIQLMLPISASIALDDEIPKSFIVVCCFVTFNFYAV